MNRASVQVGFCLLLISSSWSKMYLSPTIHMHFRLCCLSLIVFGLESHYLSEANLSNKAANTYIFYSLVH